LLAGENYYRLTTYEDRLVAFRGSLVVGTPLKNMSNLQRGQSKLRTYEDHHDLGIQAVLNRETLLVESLQSRLDRVLRHQLQDQSSRSVDHDPQAC